MMRTALLALILVAILPGCAWLKGITSLGEEDESVKPRELESFKKEVDLKQRWSTKIGKGTADRAIRLVPALSDNRIFAASANGSVKALNTSNGRKIWEVNILNYYQGAERANAFAKDVDVITGGVGVGEGMLAVGSAAGEIIVMNQSDGTLAWRARTSSEVLSRPQIDGDLAVVHTIDGKITAYNALDGERLWVYSMTLPSLSLRGTATPIVTSQFVVGAFANGRFALLNRESGLAAVDRAIGLAQGKSDLERLVDIDGNMVIDGQRLYIAGFQSNIIAVNLNTAQIEWGKESSSVVGLGEGFGNIYVGGADGVISAYDALSGKPVWEIDSLTNRDITTPVTASSYVVVGDFEGYLHVIAQSDGRFVGRRKVDGNGLYSPAVADGNRVYVMGTSGSLSAYDIQ